MGVVKEADTLVDRDSITRVPPSDNKSSANPWIVFLGSLLVMLPWPLLGIGACSALSLFEKSNEAVLMFGGVTLFFLIPLGLIVESEGVLCVLIGIVWLLALVLPPWIGRKSRHTRFNPAVMLICQCCFSAIQSGLGFLLVLGKQV